MKAQNLPRAAFVQVALLACLLCSVSTQTLKAQRSSRARTVAQPPAAPAPADSLPFMQGVANYFSALAAIPKEKAYVHLDKPLYNAGDSLWFKGYLVNGMLYSKPAISNYLYVELFNEADSLILRKKIKRDTLGGFANALPLPSKLDEGEYSLRAWSTWMQNRPQDYFFERKVYITNSLDMTLDKAREEAEAAEAEAAAAEAPKKRGRGQKQELVSGPAFTARFFPEGGPLLQGVMQKVAFRVAGAKNLPLTAEGFVFCTDSLTQRVDTVSRLKTEHDGMGQIILSARPGCTYQACIRTAEGQEETFDLPPVQAEGITLSMSQYNNKIRYQILRTPGLAFTDSLYLMVQSRGLLLHQIPLGPQSGGGVLDGRSLPEGVIHFLLVAPKHYTPLAERLILVQHPELQQWNYAAADQPKEARRRVDLSITGLNPEVLSGGTFSVSVTNRDLVPPDSAATNIRSSLLLDSELRGPLFNPGYYVGNGETPGKAFHSDLLLLCHGWRKYADFDFHAPRPAPDTAFFMERGQFIDGYTENLFGKPITEGELVALSVSPFVMSFAKLDTLGKFLFEGLSFPDSTVFVIQARNKRGRSNMTLVANEQVFPSNASKTPTRRVDRRVSAEFLQQSKEKYYLDGGMPTYNIQEIAVTAEVKSESSSMYANLADMSYSGEKLAVYAAPNVLEFLRQLPWIEIMEDRISIRNSPGNPLLMIDDLPYQGLDMMTELEMMSMENVESIDIFRTGNTVIFGDGSSNGVINIMLKDGRIIGNDDTRPLGVINFAPLGFAKPVAFFSPQYASAEERKSSRTDLRTTVYWAPYAPVNEKGEVQLSFYLPDNPGALRVELEGIDGHGTVCRYCIDL